jgi:hypothetical protein
MKSKMILAAAFLSLFASASVFADGTWTCVTTYDCGQNGYSYKDYFGKGTSTDSKAAASSAAKADAAAQCEAECASLARPPYVHPTCSWGMNGSCTKN